MIESISLLHAIRAISKLDDQKQLNRDKFPVFNTDETDPEKFWNSLGKGKFMITCGKRYYDNKHQVGSLALHNGLIKPSTGWDGNSTKYKNLSKKQQRVIKIVLGYKDEPYTSISLRGLCGNLFRV